MNKILCICPDDLSSLIFCKTLSGMIDGRDDCSLTTLSPVADYAAELDELHSKHINVSMHRYISPLGDLRYFWKVLKAIRRGSFDTVVTFTTKPNIFGAIAARLAGATKIVVAIRGMGRVFVDPTGLKNRILFYIVRLLYTLGCKSASHVWFTSLSDLEYFRSAKMVKQSQEFVTPNAVNLDDFSTDSISEASRKKLRDELALNPDELIVIMVARLIWAKGIKEFCEASISLKDRLPNVRFLLVAPEENGSPGAVPIEYIRNAEAQSRLQWLGFRKDVRQLYDLCDLSVLPSYLREGGYPRALLEAMAFGKPVIAADTETCRAPVEPGRNGYLVPPRDAAALADKIEEIFVDDDRRRRFGERSLAKMHEEFDDRVVFGKLLDLLLQDA